MPVTCQVVADEYHHPVEDEQSETHGSPPLHPSLPPRTTAVLSRCPSRRPAVNHRPERTSKKVKITTLSSAHKSIVRDRTYL